MLAACWTRGVQHEQRHAVRQIKRRHLHLMSPKPSEMGDVGNAIPSATAPAERNVMTSCRPFSDGGGGRYGSDLLLAAVDKQFDAIDEACVVRGEEKHRARDFLGLRDASGGDQAR